MDLYGKGVHSSLHSHSHHQTIYAKSNLKAFYPPPYQGTILDNTDHTKKEIDIFGWESRLNISTSISKCPFLTKQLGMLCLFVINEIITCDDWNIPRMSQYIKNFIIAKNKLWANS